MNPRRPSSTPVAAIVERLANVERIVVMTGAGVSAESGIPTFRGAGNGLWRQFDPAQLATAEAFRKDEAFVWGWYRWRTAIVEQAQPNAGHLAVAALENIRPGLVVVTMLWWLSAPPAWCSPQRTCLDW